MQNGIEGFLGKMKQTGLNHRNFFSKLLSGSIEC